MENLVICSCSHAIDSHAEGGCSGDRRFACACKLSRSEALDGAIRDVRTRYEAGERPAGTR